MNNFFKNCLSTLTVLFLAVAAEAQTLTPKYSNEFLTIGAGARALGLANTHAAVANDVTAAYWNPAGLLKIKEKYQVALMHNAYFGGIANYDYAGFATPIDQNGHIGFSIIRMGVDDIPDTRFLIDNDGRVNYNNIGSFAEVSYAFMLSYARKTLVKGLSLGVNAKVINRSAGIFANAWGFGIDAGIQYEKNKWLFGLMVRDITSTFNVWNYNPETFKEVAIKTGNKIPNNSIEITLPRALLDVAREFKFSEKISLLATAGAVFTFDGKRNTLLSGKVVSADLQGGVEINYRQLAFLRAGVGNFQRLQNFDGSQFAKVQPTFGVGFKIKSFVVDYALTNMGVPTGTALSHVFSVKASWQ